MEDELNLKNNTQEYQFFLSELFRGDEEELGYIVELMRFADHIRDIRRLLLLLSPDLCP